jgi:uncharacterized protein (DUF1778 family)
MGAARTATPQRRLEVLITSEQEERFLRAAELQGRTLEEFVLSSAEVEAEATFGEQDASVIRLSPRDSLIFAEAILDPTEPNEHLRAAAQRYRELAGE